MYPILLRNRLVRNYYSLFNIRLNVQLYRSFRIANASTSDQSRIVKPLNTQFLPELYPPSQKNRSDHQNNEFIHKTLFRSETSSLFNRLVQPYLKQRFSSTPPNLALIDGPRGIGKTTILAQTVAQAREKGFIVLFISNARLWTDGPGFFCPVADENFNPVHDGPSTVRYYDRPTQTRSVFKNLLEAHTDTLVDIPYSKELGSDITDKCDTLYDLISLGLSYLDNIDNNWRTNPMIAGQILHQTVLELSSCSTVPFALVIDNYHSFVGMTCMVNDRKRRLHANSVRAIAQLFGRDAIERVASKIKNGFVLLAAEDDPPLMEWRQSRVVGVADFPLGKHIFKDVSGRRWLRDFRSRIADPENTRSAYMPVSDCVPGELKAMCATFSYRGLRDDHSQSNSRLASDRLAVLAGGRGREMARIFATR